jgi:hypothetical protein
VFRPTFVIPYVLPSGALTGISQGKILDHEPGKGQISNERACRFTIERLQVECPGIDFPWGIQTTICNLYFSLME